eukprot:6214557-Pleurochrysis_carterae.AAC.2
MARVYLRGQRLPFSAPPSQPVLSSHACARAVDESWLHDTLTEWGAQSDMCLLVRVCTRAFVGMWAGTACERRTVRARVRKVIDDLVARQLGDWREDAEPVTSEQDHVGGLDGRRRGQLGVGDVLERVRASRVLGDGEVVVVRHARVGRDHAVLNHRAEADRRMDLGLRLWG